MSISTDAEKLQLTQYNNSYIRTWDFTLANGNAHRHSSEMINQDEKSFAVYMLERNSEGETFLTRVCFIDEANFSVSGILNPLYVRISVSEPPTTCDYGTLPR